MSIASTWSLVRIACPWLVTSSLALASASCSPADQRPTQRGASTAFDRASTNSADIVVDRTGSASTTAHGAAGSGTAIVTDPIDGCIGTSTTAPPSGDAAVDVVWVVDASGSMLDEQRKVAANLGQFADGVSHASIDLQIVMLTTSPSIPVICPATPPDPLAGTSLDGDPRYHFVQTFVSSNNPLDVAAEDFGNYAGFLRPHAVTHFVVISDDDSEYQEQPSPEARATAFERDMRGLLGGRSFYVHSIASEGPEPCDDPNCMPDEDTGLCVFVMLGCGAAEPGATYYALSDMTNGLTASICQSDWRTIFEPLTAAVIGSAPLPCDYQVPPPPRGESLDPGQVNVRWTAPGAGPKTLFGKVGNETACQDQLGWHFDNEATPERVTLCPSACAAITAGGTISITFGCATVVLQ